MNTIENNIISDVGAKEPIEYNELLNVIAESIKYNANPIADIINQLDIM